MKLIAIVSFLCFSITTHAQNILVKLSFDIKQEEFKSVDYAKIRQITRDSILGAVEKQIKMKHGSEVSFYLYDEKVPISKDIKADYILEIVLRDSTNTNKTVYIYEDFYEASPEAGFKPNPQMHTGFPPYDDKVKFLYVMVSIGFNYFHASIPYLSPKAIENTSKTDTLEYFRDVVVKFKNKISTMENYTVITNMIRNKCHANQVFLKRQNNRTGNNQYVNYYFVNEGEKIKKRKYKNLMEIEVWIEEADADYRVRMVVDEKKFQTIGDYKIDLKPYMSVSVPKVVMRSRPSVLMSSLGVINTLVFVNLKY